MTTRVWVVCFALVWLACAQASDLEAQEMPRAALEAAMRHVAGTGVYGTVVATDRFPDPQVAREIADAIGLKSGANSDLVECRDERRRNCHIIDGNRIVRFSSFEMNEGDVRLRLIVSSETQFGDENRVHLTLREIIVTPTSGGWEVTGDRVLIRS